MNRKGIAIDDLIPLFVGVLTIVIIIFILVAAGKLKDIKKQEKKQEYTREAFARQAIAISLRNETSKGTMAEFIAHLPESTVRVLLILSDTSYPAITSFRILNDNIPCENFRDAATTTFTERIYLPSQIHGIVNVDFCVRTPK